MRGLGEREGEARNGIGGREKEERNSKDSKINSEGRRLCNFIKERGWSILNGNIRGDEEGEWTYTGRRRDSVIDYVIGDERTRERVRKIKVEGKADSDHQPITVWIEGAKKQGNREGKRKRQRGGMGEYKEKFRTVFGEKGRGGRRMGRVKKYDRRNIGEDRREG